MADEDLSKEMKQSLSDIKKFASKVEGLPELMEGLLSAASSATADFNRVSDSVSKTASASESLVSQLENNVEIELRRAAQGIRNEKDLERTSLLYNQMIGNATKMAINSAQTADVVAALKKEVANQLSIAVESTKKMAAISQAQEDIKKINSKKPVPISSIAEKLRNAGIEDPRIAEGATREQVLDFMSNSARDIKSTESANLARALSEVSQYSMDLESTGVLAQATSDQSTLKTLAMEMKISNEKILQDQKDAKQAEVDQKREALYLMKQIEDEAHKEDAQRTRDAAKLKKEIEDLAEMDRRETLRIWRKAEADAYKEQADRNKEAAKLQKEIDDLAEMDRIESLRAWRRAEAEAYKEQAERDKQKREEDKKAEEATKNNKAGIAKLFGFFASMLDDLLKYAREISKQLSISLQEGADRALNRYITQIGSVFGIGSDVFLSKEEQGLAASGFLSNFGTILRKDLEVQFAEEAKLRKMTADQLLTATRSLTGIAGGFNTAKNLFLEGSIQFNNAGMSTAEASKFATQNSELLARAGKDSATEIFRLGAQARQAGFELSKIESFADRLAMDFGSFLDQAAELSALGIDLNIADLAEASLSGDREGMIGVLRSSLGSSIDNLTRVQQVQLSSTLGIPLNELLNLMKGEAIAADIQEDADLKAADKMTDSAILFERAAVIFSSSVQLFAGSAILSQLGSKAGIVGTIASLLGRAGMLAGGAGLAIGAISMVTSMFADDMVSRPGYGNRSLVAGDRVVNLNNEDTVVAYADDMISGGDDLTTLQKGAIVNEMARNQSQKVVMNTKALEDKIDSLKNAIASASKQGNVYLDGRRVGTVLKETMRVTDGLSTTRNYDYGD